MSNMMETTIIKIKKSDNPTQLQTSPALLSASSIPNFKNKQIKSTHKLSLSFPRSLHYIEPKFSVQTISIPHNQPTTLPILNYSSASSNHYHHYYFIIFSLFISKVSSQIPIMFWYVIMLLEQTSRFPSCSLLFSLFFLPHSL